MVRVSPTRRAVLTGALICPFGAAAGQAGAPAWPSGARAAVSLTYDDGLDSQLEHVLPALEARGLKGTFFLVRENIDARIGDWVAAASQGHEMGDHTVSHQCQLGSYTETDFREREILPMEAYMDLHFGARPVKLFAYPCGFLGLGRGDMRRRFGRYRLALEDTFACARTVAGAPNDPAKVMADRFDLKAFEPTYEADSLGPAVRYLDEAVARGGWAILVFHEVLPVRAQEGDTTVATHERILDLIGRKPLWCAPMGEVFARLARASDQA